MELNYTKISMYLTSLITGYLLMFDYITQYIARISPIVPREPVNRRSNEISKKE